jgi:hypothetical protein
MSLVKFIEPWSHFAMEHQLSESGSREVLWSLISNSNDWPPWLTLANTSGLHFESGPGSLVIIFSPAKK